MPVLSPTNAFIDTLRFGAYLVEARCTIYQGGNPTSFIVPISTAEITVSRTAAQRRSGQITAELVPSVPPPVLLPTSPSSLLAPFGNEIYLESGIHVNGTVNWVPLGLFSLATTTVEDTTTDLAVTLNVYDRSWVISQRAFTAPYNVPAAGGNFAAEIKALLNQVWGSTPALSYNITPTSATVPTASYNEGADPWQAAQDMATAVGYELFFDVHGVVTAYPIPDPTTLPVVWNFTDQGSQIFGLPGQGSTALSGSPYSTPVGTLITFTRDRIYNDVIVSGTGSQNAAGGASGSSAPVRGEAADTNPNSATYTGGPMGDIPEFISSSMVLSTAQANAAALNELRSVLASSWQITVTGPPNPIFDIDDVVTVTRPRVGLNNVAMVIDEITHVVKYGDLLSIQGRVIP